MTSIVRFDEDEVGAVPGMCRCGKGVSGLHIHTADGYQIVSPGDLIVDGQVFHPVETRKPTAA